MEGIAGRGFGEFGGEKQASVYGQYGLPPQRPALPYVLSEPNSAMGLFAFSYNLIITYISVGLSWTTYDSRPWWDIHSGYKNRS